MSIEELEQAGILLPREEWGKQDLRTRVARIPLIAVAIGIVTSLGLMYFGGGYTLTWIGFAMFLVMLLALTVLNLRGIKRSTTDYTDGTD